MLTYRRTGNVNANTPGQGMLLWRFMYGARRGFMVLYFETCATAATFVITMVNVAAIMLVTN